MSEDKIPQDYSAKSEVGFVRVRRTKFQRTLIDLKKAPPTALLGMIIILTYIIVALFAPQIAPYGEAEVFMVPYAPWGGDHILGTDQIGRDIFTRLIYGARNTVGIALMLSLIHI